MKQERGCGGQDGCHVRVPHHAKRGAVLLVVVGQHVLQIAAGARYVEHLEVGARQQQQQLHARAVVVHLLRQRTLHHLRGLDRHEEVGGADVHGALDSARLRLHLQHFLRALAALQVVALHLVEQAQRRPRQERRRVALHRRDEEHLGLRRLLPDHEQRAVAVQHVTNIDQGKGWSTHAVSVLRSVGQMASAARKHSSACARLLRRMHSAPYVYLR
jgi:hypothetical protein